MLTGHDAVSIRWPDVVAALAWPDGARRLLGRDGLSVTVVPTDWQGGDRALALLDHGTPVQSRVPVGGASPAPVIAQKKRRKAV